MIFTEKDFTKTVYSIGWSETIKTLNEYRQKDNSFLFDETWTKKQDNLHQEYLSLWKKSQEANISSIEDLNFGYPTNGSSEAIFMQLTHLNSKGKRLVVFKEEYEGYSMFAKNINMPLFFVDRDNVEWSLINPINDVFFISQPSSIDGNIWNGFDNFMQSTQDKGISVYIDLAYVGLFEHEAIKLNYKNIDGIFFSLSKIFGVYYHRIGGCFLREENPLLWPMLWFKNLNSIGYGQELLKKKISGAFEKDFNNAKNLQVKICDEMSKKLNLNIIPSDVPMIATVEYDDKIDWLKGLLRSGEAQRVRICISKLLEQSLKG